MDQRMINLSVTLLGLVLAAHAILALTKRRWVTCLLEILVTVVLFWQQWQLYRSPTSAAPQT